MNTVYEDQATKDLSIVVPVFNEEENIKPLHEEITRATVPLDLDYEVIYVDDGSSDGSVDEVKALFAEDKRVVLVRFRRNFGQTAGFSAGFAAAQGRVVMTMDADRQNDPADIPALLAKLDETGADVVNGWRKDRQDGFLMRKLPSKIANKMIANSTGVKLKDRGCSMRAFRFEVVKDLHLYGEMHRFIPEMVNEAGYSMVEVPVNHRPRVAGQSKYGLSRTFRVLLDLVTVLFLSKYGDRPMHLFGWVGILSGFTGFLMGAWMSVQKILAGLQGGWAGFQAYEIGERPLLLLAILLIILGVQFLISGLTAELLVRTYYESQNKPVYRVKEVVRDNPSLIRQRLTHADP
ncbi:MAG: glycosyltransferase family 2 protein [Ardenticatenaceae bacterium]|nr:glycosyltransferase family 2 protein [Ardenticatenaceae bacterium]